MSAWVIGLHLLSLHAPSCYAYGPECRPYEQGTVGVYVRDSRGITVGAYRNSYGESSAYAGWTFETSDKRFSLAVLGATGYRRASVVPIIAPSIRIPISSSLALRLAGSPKTPGNAALVHLAIEAPL